MSAPGTAVLPILSKYEMEIERINLAVLLYNCVAGLEDRARDKQISFVINDDIDNLPLISGDRYMLQLMFSNIIDNAIKYSRVNKEVRIYAERNDGRNVSISIEDFGWGIPKSDLYKIFEANYRNTDVANKKIQSRGIGLGLFQAQQFTNLHGGDISVSSVPISGDNNIVKFTVRLPV
jgi:signal transduction histidine kinase